MAASIETNGMVRLPLKRMVIMRLAAISNSAKVIIAVVISNSAKVIILVVIVGVW
jgi:hypothetical protein